jgi:PAS domain S-box-containing protein
MMWPAILRLRFPRSLHAQLMLSLLVLATLVAGGSAFVALRQAQERRLVELDERASRIADLLSQSLAQPLWNVDRDAIARQLNTLRPNPEVVRLTVTATNFGVLADVSNAPAPRADEMVVRVRPVEYTPPGEAPRERIGEVRVELTRAVAAHDLVVARETVLATLCFVLAVLYIATFLLIRHLVREPIRRLEEMVDRIAGGDLDARCTIESRAELGRLAARVNVMAERLRTSTASLRESELKYRSIIENSLEGIFVLGRDGRLRDANRAMARLLGYRDVAGLLDPSAPGAAFVAARPLTTAQVARLFAMLEPTGEIAGLELPLTRADGTALWCQLNARGTGRDAAGALRLEGQLTDMSARRQAMEDLTRHRDQLEQEVHERVRTELELRDSREKLRQLSAHQESVREEERRQIAMTIHDELGQLLTAIKMDISLLKRLPVQTAEWHDKAAQMGELVERTIDIVRNIASHLRPAALNFGLLSALEWLVQDFSRHNSTTCAFRLEGAEPCLNDDRATAVFRIAQEALTNVSRHAQASRVDVVLRTVGQFALEIRDDGIGFDVADAASGGSYGVQGMKERARMIGAQLHIVSDGAAGSIVRLQFAESLEAHVGQIEPAGD